MKKTFEKVLSAVTACALAFTLAVSTTTTANAASTQSSNAAKYVALGDSVTAPADGYVSMIANSLGITYKNYGVSGYVSNDTLNQIKNNANVRSSIKNAEILTLDIGSNDMMYAMIEHICNALGCENGYYPMMTELKRLQTRYENAKGFEKIRVSAEIAYKAAKVNQAVNSQTNMEKSTSEYKTRLENIIKEIRKINPNIKIYLGNIYNPSFDAPVIKIGSYTIVDFYKLTDTWDNAYNAKISAVASKYGYKVADVHAAMNDKTYINGTWASGNFEPHPSQAGHKAIANAFLAVMK